jgi:hypothetical protein
VSSSVSLAQMSKSCSLRSEHIMLPILAVIFMPKNYLWSSMNTLKPRELSNLKVSMQSAIGLYSPLHAFKPRNLIILFECHNVLIAICYNSRSPLYNASYQRMKTHHSVQYSSELSTTIISAARRIKCHFNKSSTVSLTWQECVLILFTI